jgi:DNA-binding transcriptional MocR family regulator
MVIQLIANSKQPVYRQIADAIQQQVRQGLLRTGEKLPSTRQLADSLKVNRTTVCLAYDQLKQRGFVESHVGRGTRILGGGENGKASRGGDLAWEQLLSSGMKTLLRTLAPRRADAADIQADFSRLIPDQNLFPVEAFEAILKSVIRKQGAGLFQYGPALGLPALRSLIAQRMKRWGIAASDSEIIIVNGAQQGMDLLFKALIEPGDVVVVESPTYANILPLLGFYRAQVVGVNMTSGGLDLEAFRAIAAQRAPKLIYTIPNFQNPTGICTSSSHRRHLLRIAEEFNVPILEDGYEEDLRTSGRGIQPIKASDRAGHVIYLGTFSKGLFPGLRIGWIVANRSLIETLGAAKFTTDYHTSLLLQAALAEFLSRGHYDRHLKRLQRILASRLQVAMSAMKKHFPRGVHWTSPDGGYSVWITVPAGVSARRIAEEAQREGVLITAGDYFFNSSDDCSSFRMSVSTADENQIRDGIELLGKVIARQIQVSPGTGSIGGDLPHI